MSRICGDWGEAGVGGEGARRHVACEIAAVADRPLDDTLFRSTIVETLDSRADLDALHLGRLTAHDRRDDLDRGQHIPPTAAEIASLSAPRGAVYLAPADALGHPLRTA
jgi:hypothetical protein